MNMSYSRHPVVKATVRRFTSSQIDVLHERVHIFCRRGAVIHVVRVFVHIEHKQRPPHGNVVHVVPGPVIVEFTRVSILRKDYPT